MRHILAVSMILSLASCSSAQADTGYLAGKIQVTIELDRTVYHAGDAHEGVFVTAWYTNVSSETVQMPHPTLWGNHALSGEYFALFDDSGAEITAPKIFIEWDPDEVTDVVLSPGESWYTSGDMGWSGQVRQAEVPGQYSVQERFIYYDNVPYPEGMSEQQAKDWHDAHRQFLYSNVVPFEVIDAGAKAPKRQPEVKVAVGKTSVKPKLPLYRVRGQLVSSADVLEKAGVKVKTEKESVTLTRGKRQIEFALQRNKAKVNGKWQRIPVAAMRSQGEVILPLKLAAQALGIRTSWDQAHSTLRLNG